MRFSIKKIMDNLFLQNKASRKNPGMAFDVKCHSWIFHSTCMISPPLSHNLSLLFFYVTHFVAVFRLPPFCTHFHLLLEGPLYNFSLQTCDLSPIPSHYITWFNSMSNVNSLVTLAVIRCQFKVGILSMPPYLKPKSPHSH